MLLNSTLAEQCMKMSPYSKLTQAGIDISAMKIQKINDHYVPLLLRDKTIIPSEMYEDLSKIQYPPNLIDKGTTYIGWYLSPGIYSVTFNEGIIVPKNAQAKVTHRSSIFRIGNIIESPWWDAGFYCDNMNSTLIVNSGMFVEENARLAQVVFHEMHEPKELYDGQWQGLSAATHARK